ncbi:Low-specificity L-threonine aldolase [Candidatus Rhodobacter oscarellae]|uniref:L-threonine aldolase n=1 Tax=Candidatus Rhodobacter oscarellae TaxID=1675527 RepID=A0A0J9GYK3_9RHOB|nr:low specificity L-threonine aldolase [Candidatus Rhodobacter lobularis]KMW58563.1 Low-specificity L-threonine aldolase [Candidatus Rhodobacter lobularis]
MYFASDNSSPAHPSVMEALARANQGYMGSYGADPIMDEVRDRIREIFEAPEAAVYLVCSGTTANVLSLGTFCPPWGAIYCHRDAHIEVDECGGPEFYTGGAKLVLIDGTDAKMDPGALRAAIGRRTIGDVHHVQPGMVSVTNVTEMGAVYSATEVAAINAVAEDHHLPVHMDGARFANALVASGATPAEMTWRAGVDVLSFGGTKNGLMAVEAVVIFDPAKAWEFELRRKRGGHLFSKHRYLSAQMQAYLADDLWLSMARASNGTAGRLAQGLAALPGASLVNSVDANMIFAKLTRAQHKAAFAAGAKYYLTEPGAGLDEGPDDEPLTCRLVTSWCTSDADVDGFLAACKS